MQTLLIKTSIPCRPQNLSNRRKNIISQAIDVLGREGAHNLFHNHKERKALHRYPLIQYRVQNNLLSIFAIGEAVSVLIKVVVEADLENTAHRITLNNVRMQKGKAEITKSSRNEYYRLMDWIAFNNETFNEKWRRSYSLLERVGLLNNAITGHLRILGHQLEQRDELEGIQGELMMITSTKDQMVYGQKMMGLNVIFRTPYHLPEYCALGRSISIGAGTFQKLRTHPENNDDNTNIMSIIKSNQTTKSELEQDKEWQAVTSSKL